MLPAVMTAGHHHQLSAVPSRSPSVKGGPCPIAGLQDLFEFFGGPEAETDIHQAGPRLAGVAVMAVTEIRIPEDRRGPDAGIARDVGLQQARAGIRGDRVQHRRVDPARQSGCPLREFHRLAAVARRSLGAGGQHPGGLPQNRQVVRFYAEPVPPLCDRIGDDTVGQDLGIVADAFDEPIDDSWCSPGTGGNFRRPVTVNRDAEHPG